MDYGAVKVQTVQMPRLPIKYLQSVCRNSVGAIGMLPQKIVMPQQLAAECFAPDRSTMGQHALVAKRATHSSVRHIGGDGRANIK